MVSRIKPDWVPIEASIIVGQWDLEIEGNQDLLVVVVRFGDKTTRSQAVLELDGEVLVRETRSKRKLTSARGNPTREGGILFSSSLSSSLSLLEGASSLF